MKTTRITRSYWPALLAGAVCAFGLTSCPGEEKTPEAGAKESMEKAGDGAKEAAEGTKDAAEKAAGEND